MLEASHGTITTARPYGSMRPGDRVIWSGDTNRVRRRIIDVGSATRFETATYIRPSKGFRRHVRREKARETSQG